ncbi:MAG TPA: hypothetical protein VM409_05255 [Chloroflexia bacterium]|nr:hypothetical protein [Chloroflexia bacterium]
MDTVTYPDPQVSDYIERHFVAVKAMLDLRASAPLFRSHGIIWTPTAGFSDRNGVLHYQSVGYLPPNEFIATLKIGRARCLMAWTRSAEAAAELAEAADMETSFCAESIYWLGIARFLQRRDTAGMWEAWDRLVALYPESSWANKIYDREA